MENDNNLNKKEILNINDQNQNEPQQEVQKQINNNRYEEEFNIEQINELNNDDREQIIQNSEENNTENDDEKIIIENENEDIEENNNEEIVLEENEEYEEKELYNKENEEDEIDEIEEKENFPVVTNDQNNNIKIEEYEPELDENKNEKNEKKEEYILNKLSKIKNNNKLKVKTNNIIIQENDNQFNNIGDKIIQNETNNKEPINTKTKKLIYLTPVINSCRVDKKEGSENHKYNNNEGENPLNIEDSDKNIIKNKKENTGNYLYTKKNLKDKNIKFNSIKNVDDKSNKIDSDNLRKNVYNKSNDDIKRILNLDNNDYGTENLLNYNNLMNIWRHRYSKKSHLYKKINSDFNLNFKREKNDKMVKRTNSILRMASHNYAFSLTDSTDTNNFLLKNNFSSVKDYKIPIYYNGIINRKYSNPLLKKNNFSFNFNKYNPLLKARTNKNIFAKRNINFTDILRAKLNNSDDFNNINKYQIERKSYKNNFLSINNRYNSNTDNILKNNLYIKILQTNRQKEISKNNGINNNGYKKYSIIKKNIFNIIKDTNNKKKKKKNKNLVLSIKANQLISSYNEEFKKKKKF